MPSRSSTGRGPLVAATLIVVGVVVIILLLAAGGVTPQRLWESFFPPPSVTVQGDEVRSLYDLVFYIAVAIFLVVEIAIVYTVFRYRRKPGDDTLPPQTHGNNLVEIIWTVIPTVIVAVLFFFSWQSLTKVDAVSADAPVQIRAVAARFQWTFDYLDPTSQDPGNDPAVFQQFIPQGDAGGMRVPVGVPVKVTLISPDVIHAFYVPQFLFKKDVVPGAANQFEFTADQTGVYRGQCAELCGAFHGAMQFEVHVLEQAAYQAWFDEQVENANQPSPSPSVPGPSASPGASPGGPPPAAITIGAQDIAFDKATLEVPAGADFILRFDNREAQLHNVEIKDQAGTSIFQGEIFQGPGVRDYQVPAIQPGSYTFVCTVHPNMTGTLTAS